MRIFVDMDGTLATISPDTGKRWSEPGYFWGLAPYPSMLGAVKTLIAAGADVWIITTVHTIAAIQEKDAWLRRYLPELRASKRIYAVPGKPKGAFVPGGVQDEDILIDDHTPNLLEWTGIGIKAVNPINHKKGVWQGPTIDVRKAERLTTALWLRRVG